MKSLILKKEYFELTDQEIKREYNLIKWLLRMMRYFGELARYKEDQQWLASLPRESLAEDYINGIISAETYRKEKVKTGRHEYYREMWRDRREFCDRMEKALQGEMSVLGDMLHSGDGRQNNEKMGRPRKKANSKYAKRYFGYDPRKYKSKYNYIKLKKVEDKE